LVRVYLGSDHAGYELKAALVAWLREAGHDPVDCGPASYLPDDDYPPYVMKAAKSVIDHPGSLGIVIGGSGNGEQIAANKVPGIRAALAWTIETAQLARQHNNANVLSLGARMYSTDDAISFAKIFVETPFSAEPRHERRLAMIADYEKTSVLPALLSSGGATPRTPRVPPGGPDRKNRDLIRPARRDKTVLASPGRD
jgi:ribose 5-phosphate isomerase B